MRLDLVPRPDPQTTSDLNAGGELIGKFGAGLFLLFSEGFRVTLGYDWRRGARGFEPHPRSRTLFAARKCIPWMHHASVPHAILERPGGDCEWLAVLGAFGPRFDWGDGSEANFPQYGILKVARDRRGSLWDDGESLALAVADTAGESDLSRVPWQFQHRPGLLRLENPGPGPVESLTATCPPGERALQVTVTLRGEESARALLIRTRVLLRRLTVAPADWTGPIDVLDAPFGFQNFHSHDLEPQLDGAGVRFHCANLDTDTGLFTRPAPEAVELAPADPCDEEFQEETLGALREGMVPGPCHDVRLRVACPGPGPVVLRVSLEQTASRASVRFPAETRASEELENVGLRLHTGDRYVDGLWRWSRYVAQSLCWPNGVITTGALGYGAKSHVGQDVPLIWPLFVLDPHPRLQSAARRMLEYVIDSPREPRHAGILDHPCDGRDFAFLPQRPTSARVFKRHGAAGLMRWVLCLERGLAAGLDRTLVRRGFDRLDALFRAHLVPFSPRRSVWHEGEETQGLAYSVTTAIAAVAALQSMALEFRGEVDGVYRRERQRLRRHLLTSTRDGGLRLCTPVRRGSARLERGWFVAPGQDTRRDWRFSFDVPLLSAHALLYGDLPRSAGERLTSLLAHPGNPWRVEGSGLAKCQGGHRGVWFWHNAMVAKGLMQAGELDVAWEHFTWMGRAMADINGLGIPGEEINGGDYAMGIGALAGLALIEGLLGLRVAGSRTWLRPRLPAALDGFEMSGLSVGGKVRDLRVRRTGSGSRVAARETLVADQDRLEFVV